MKAVIAAIVLSLVACARAGGSSTQSDAPPAVADSMAVIDSGADANSCAVQPCDIAPQCGCPMAQACDLSSTGSGNACRSALATGVEGAACSSAAKCAAGYTCVGSNFFECEKYCESSADCLAPRGQCVKQLVDGSSNPIPGAVMCSSNCDPAAASDPLCPTNWSCDLFTATYMGTDHDIVDCRRNGTAALNAACSATNTCAAGLTCATVNGSPVCKKLCNVTANTGCTSGTCTAFGTPFIVGGTNYGVCL